MHPIVAQMAPNEEQLPAILARNQDLVVTAGAGTGKTRTLVARYLSLLSDGVPMRAIVAITFTRKAAQEMRNRVRAEIRRYLDQPALYLEERRHWDGLYNELDAARIGTIHNLCTEILRAHPAEVGVDPRLDVLDESQASILSLQAVDEALAWAADDPEAVKLFALLGEWRLRPILEDLMGQRLEAQAAFEHLPDPLWPFWEARLALPLQAFIDDNRVREAFSKLLALKANGTLARAEAAGDALAGPLRHLLALWQEILSARQQDDWLTVSAHLLPLRQNMKLSGRKNNWEPADPKAFIAELRSLYDRHLAAWIGSKGSDRGINLALDRSWAEALPALRQLFLEATRAYQRLKDDRQVLDFDDLEREALKLLRDWPAVQNRWQGEVAAILVDEYQDTNGRQRDLVNLLNGSGGKLFIVGDAKQSIYRFRGADVTVFREERKRIEASGGNGYSLSKSYRAHKALIQGLNDLLKPLLGEAEDHERPWREPFSPLTHHRKDPKAGLAGPYVELLLAVGSKADGAFDRAAVALASHIVDLLSQENSDLSYGDVAILCRASTSFAAYEDALDSAGLPYLTVAGRGFYDRPEIRDLLNAMQALADPTDDLALAGLLRSPVLGFSDVDLYDLCRQSIDATGVASLWEGLQVAGEEKAERAVRLIGRLYGRAGRTPVADLLKAFLDDTDYRAALLQAGYPRAARNVSKLLVDAQTSGIVSVGEFLEYVSGLRASAAREGEARATAGDVVRIMSVHAAKGLEFPITVIGDVSYKSRAGGGLILDSELGIFPRLEDDQGASAGLYRLLQAREADQEAAEADRLLYVAATRAQEKLILNGTIKLTSSSKPGWLAGWLKQIAGPINLAGQVADYDATGDRAIRLDLQVGQTPVGCTIFEPGSVKRPMLKMVTAEEQPAADWSPDLLQTVVPDSQLVDERTREQEREPARRVWQVVPAATLPQTPAWPLGKVVHEALAAWRFPDQGFARWLEARVRSYGLTGGEQIRGVTQEAELLLIRFREHPLFKEMATAERRLHEVPYSILSQNGRPEQGIIDALYLHGGVWTLVDFKTDRARDAQDFERLLAKSDYVAQVGRYAEAVRRLLGQRPRIILCMLNYADRIHLKMDFPT